MKKVILSVAAMIAFTAVSFAQTSAVVTAEAVVANADENGDDKKKVDADALPAAVKKTLASDDYKEWKLVTAWHVMGANEHYVLEMKKGDDVTSLKMNKEGQII